MNYDIALQIKELKGKIIWLASYPKSGNTWLRAFFTALTFQKEINLNNLIQDAYFPSREKFYQITGINPNMLTMEEIEQLRPRYIDYLTESKYVNRLLFIKIHDQFKKTPNEFINHQNTQAIIYIVRNPLSIISSASHFFDITKDEAIINLNSETYQLAFHKLKDTPKFQFPQKLGSWSNHVDSWVNNPIFPVVLVRYEDLLNDPQESFAKIVSNIGLKASSKQIAEAISRSSFKQLKSKEQNGSFIEKLHANKSFFREGKIDNWKDELTKIQFEQIVKRHKDMMNKLNYL